MPSVGGVVQVLVHGHFVLHRGTALVAPGSFMPHLGQRPDSSLVSSGVIGQA